MPDFAKKFLGEYNDRHPAPTPGTSRPAPAGSTVELKGVPLKISADMKVSGSGNATVTFNWLVSCSIPLLGGKLEKLIADDIRAKSAADMVLSNQLLADY